ncbi:DUF971 domain-containing protein [Candidatus Poribacteria bacterium]|nr:DUF971 domain-containing protein [Candidatus Poribacteria bacterium]
MNENQPVEIRRLTNSLFIQWKDGVESECTYRTLREKCPCARCDAVRNEENPLQILPTDEFWEKLQIVNIQKVGRYAIRIQWSDGHKTGIYTYDFLRELTV